jgi:hypothetical protein
MFTGNGTLSIDNGATLTGTGVTLYFNSSNAPFSARAATLNLAAPTVDPYNGILFYQDPNDPVAMFIQNDSGTLNGIVYAPQAQFSFTNVSSPALNVSNVSFVVGAFLATGNVNVQGYAPAAGTLGPQYSPRLAE